MENKSIVIKLSESRNAKVFKNNELIHSVEFEKAKEWINDRITKRDTNKNETKERLHDTITILGSRGSGKTSFLHSLLADYKTDKDVEVIDIIDPTLIEEKGHIFLTIISQIAKVVNEKLSKSDCDPESTFYREKKEWERKLKNLAGGLPSIDGVGHGYENWDDPEFIMDKGLRSVRAAKNLESDFHELLELGLKILKKKIFILALDDIDIDFRKGWPVLETIRKYLTSPCIITLLSGDLKLFSKAIRKQQWKNFGKALMINEGEKLDRIRDYDDLVTEMEGQYLQKAMQPQRRIHLTTIQEKINIKGKEDINIYINNEKNRIDEFYNTILSKFGIKNSYQAEAYRSFLLSLPIRTQIQFLSEFEDISTKNIKEANVTDAFLSDLYEKRVDIDMAKTNNKYLSSIILKLLINEKVLDEAYQLQPTTLDVSLNSSLVALSFLFSQKTIDNPYLIFDYFIRIGYMRNLLSILPYQNDSNSSLSPSIQGLCKYSSIYFDKVYRDILGSMTAYIRAFLNIEKENSVSWGGTIPIYGLSESAKGKGDMSIRIDTVFKDAPLHKRQIAFIPVSISQPNEKQSSFTSYSIYLLLAAIGEIIKQHKEGAELDKTLAELSQIRSYSMPGFKFNSISGDDEMNSNDENDTTPTERKKEDILEKSTRNWLDKYIKKKDETENCIVSPHVLGKISTRLFYALRNLENDTFVDNLGEAMHSRIIILYNTILVEEAREVIKGKTLNNNNPRNRIDIFKENILSCDQEDFKELKLFTLFFSCPILLSYLDNNNDIIEIKKHINNSDENIWTESIYSELKHVKILPPKTSQRKNTDNDKKRIGSLYYSKGKIGDSVEHMKSNNDFIRFEDFMNEDINGLIPKLQKLFVKNVNKKAINAIRDHLEKNNISW